MKAAGDTNGKNNVITILDKVMILAVCVLNIILWMPI
jgi:hypothetical protein